MYIYDNDEFIYLRVAIQTTLALYTKEILFDLLSPPLTPGVKLTQHFMALCLTCLTFFMQTIKHGGGSEVLDDLPELFMADYVNLDLGHA